MTDPAPRKRFRFSLGFLIGWIILTGVCWGVTFNIPHNSVINYDFSNASEIRSVFVEYHGLPFANFSRTETKFRGDSEVREVYYETRLRPGMAANALLWAGFAYGLARFFAFLRMAYRIAVTID